ncbi:fructose-6-phosphate aldolase [Candidatus Bipolaricaulota bacterium]|nr:fructose-6-phosphate aldolase [Candidatus Bipolaricaulota bacterium]HBR10550.1 fructose-6-phosphate aldolase [Candidatus Acetothermia bacterium]
MKLFIDTADITEIKEMAAAGVIDGVTTNPSLVAKEGRRLHDLIAEICAVVDGPVSAEVMALNTADMVTEARKLAEIYANVVIKIPMTMDGLRAVRILASEEIATNVTLIFSPNQALLAAKAGATFASLFVGRIDDCGGDGMDLVEQVMDIYDNYAFDTEVIVASVRHPLHVVQASLIGADIATVPFSILKKMPDHPLTDIGITRFLNDWEGGTRDG